MPSDPRTLEALRIDREAKQPGSRPGLLWGALAALLLLAIAAGWYFWGAPGPVEVRAVTVEQPSQGPGAGTVLNASGYVTARRRATVSSKVTGRVVQVHVEEGMDVRRGQVLARLDPTTAERALALAEAELGAARRAVAEYEVRLDQARLNAGRVQQLSAEGIATKAQHDDADAEVKALQARLALAAEQVRVSERQVALRQADLSDTVIVAPFSGVAISKDAQPGEMISPVSAGGGFTRTGICTLVDMESLEIEVDVNESYIHRVAAGQRVEAVLDAYPDWRIPAHVITMVPTADRQKATVLVRIGFDRAAAAGTSGPAEREAPLDPRILPDMGVKVAFLGASPPPGASPSAPSPRVPAAAVRTDGGSTVVFVVKDGRAERRAVRTGSTAGEMVEIMSGLTPGERIVIESPAPLKDGLAVVVR
ncbi:MAG TPA: efflux RND transporter periplasmic adaptor subunit [Vicinamibacterales bacterium]|nr:efflux RND transporter periplasmic adaptor subunit [Acidobacteriota bacterium]HOC18952.1 efflux RND transporter periplasmic adaptor subunit [Vicinamibacterales bacterium]